MNLRAGFVAATRALCSLAIIAFAARAHAIDPWAQPGPPVTEGLEVLLDAADEAAARQAKDLPAPANGAPLTIWHDGSGRHRDFLQRFAASAPTFHSLGSAAYGACFIRFDGVDDCLQYAARPTNLKGATLILLAAPRKNPGGFRGLAALNQRGRNDYTSGMTLDLSWSGSPQVSDINGEGAGFGGAQNLLREPSAFGVFRVYTLTVPADPGVVALRVDGRPQGTRPRDARAISLDEMTLGARFYSNTAEPPFVQGFFDGDIAAALLYDRALSDEELAACEGWLRDRHPALFRLRGVEDSLESAMGREDSLAAVSHEPPGAVGGPPIQFMRPGFKARELPLELPNINNLAYRPDGSLMALGYNGAVYRLTDTDGDGLEDKSETFWEAGKLRGPIGMALTPPGYRDGDGVFVASKGKVSLLLDRDRDNKADEERIVATGWKEITQSVDALGVALDREGNIFFGLGTADYTNAYLVDSKTGESHYDIASDRGTIQKVSPDFSRRETVCTGVRFSVAVKFNARGDLFCTDQEGQTWLPGGNPLDELLHIQPGRHYGFPPRHDNYLPQVYDEPSTLDIGPEHQSTCGLCFNEAEEGAPIFGPETWRGWAFIAGYSRGKIFLTEMHPAPSGYVARNQVFAAMGMLPVEVALSPKGELRVAAHSGQPDWGSGPQGEGKLYAIQWAGKDSPRPLLAWAEGPLETRVAFDRPIPESALARIKEQAEIDYGEFVRAGDAYETFRPGYQLVQEQMVAPRKRLKIVAASLADDGRTLVLSTQPHSMRAWHAVRLPNFIDGSDEASSTIELDYTLNGTQASWEPKPSILGVEKWSGWLPHPDASTATEMLGFWAQNAKLPVALNTWGRFTIDAQIELPVGENIIRIESGSDYKLRIGSEAIGTGARGGPLELAVASEGKPLEFRLEFGTGQGDPPRLSHRLPRDKHFRPLAPERCFVPWAPAAQAEPVNESAPRVGEIEKGNWLRGRRLFFGDAKCANCHQIRGEGRNIGPDLTNLIYRDAASVLRDIRQPSAAINPDFITYTLRLANGEEISSVLRTEPSGQIRAFDNNGEERLLHAKDILEYRASSISTMPEGLEGAVGEAGLRDLLAFLLDPPPLMPPDLAGAPPPRTKAEFEAVLGRPIATLDAPLPAAPRPLRIALVAGPKDHGPGEHDYPNWQRVWERLLAMGEGVEVSTAWDWPSDADFEKADVLVFYFWNHAWTAEKGAQFDEYLARGGGMVFLHSAVIADRDADSLAERIGLSWRPGETTYRHGPLDLVFKAGVNDAITRGIERLHLVDESYWPMFGDATKIAVLAEGEEQGEMRPLIWTTERGKGRVFCSIPTHYGWTFDDPIFRLVVLRAIAWCAREEPARLEPLALAGIKLAE